MMADLQRETALSGAPPLEFKSVEQGAATPVWAAMVADGDLIGGHYCENCAVAPIADGDGFRDACAPTPWMREAHRRCGN
jgi:hypothetical protein